MDSNQTTTTTVTVPSTTSVGIFGTNIPSSAAFLVAILLFLLPFSEIKCSGTTLVNKTGLGYVRGAAWKPAGGYGKEMMGNMTSKATGSKEGNAQLFAIAALGAGVLGLLLSFLGSRSAGYIGVVCGIIGAGALIALMVDVKKWFDDNLAKEAADKAAQGSENLGLDKLGNVNATLASTPWFYIAIISFLAAAFFCYKRASSKLL